VGSYTGNGNADGTFVYLGFRPAYMMVRRSNSSDNWAIFDTERNVKNPLDEALRANTSGSTSGYSGCPSDFVSNGYKIRGTCSSLNTSDDTYIYLAFAETPFKYSNAR
jgi:hypothetical protein